MSAEGLKYHVAPSLGTQSVPNTTGSKFQFGIAVDLDNRKFEYGQVLKYSIAADDHGVSQTVKNAHQYGLSHATQDINSCPSQFIQYGDHMLLGPSTVVNYEGYTEPTRVAASGHLNDVDPTAWTAGVVYSLDRSTKYLYQLSDSATIYSTGRAEGWYMENLQGQSVGIQKGNISLNGMGRIAYGLSNVAAANTLVSTWEDTWESSTFVGLTFKLPKAMSNAQINLKEGYSTGPLNANCKGFSRDFADTALMAFRSSLYSSPFTTKADNDFFNVTGSNQKGNFRYVHSEGAGKLAYNTNSAVGNSAADTTFAGLLMGYEHPGGQYKDSAQALYTAVNGLSTISGSYNISTGIFYQPLTRSISDSNDNRFSKLVGGTYYRMGVTYRGKMTDRGPISDSSYAYTFFQWGSGIRDATSADVNTYTTQYMSTDKMLDGSAGSSGKSVANYTTKMVSAWVENPMIDLVDNSNYQAIGVVQYNKSLSTSTMNNGLGAEQMLFIDNIWLEHQGDITGASDEGYIQLEHSPEQGTLTVNRFRTSKPVTIALSDGSKKQMDITGTNQKYLHEIKCDFLYLQQTEFDKLQELLRWQDLGHKLAIHPHLPQVPDCLIGEMTLTNIRKSFWDLTRFSVTFGFIETE